MDNLTLPELTASLWAAMRSIVLAIPPETFGRIIPPHLRGAAILAAHWKHRISTNAKVVLPGSNDYNVVNQLGGASEAVTAVRARVPSSTAFSMSPRGGLRSELGPSS